MYKINIPEIRGHPKVDDDILRIVSAKHIDRQKSGGRIPRAPEELAEKISGPSHQQPCLLDKVSK
jgi:hypothetical protein